MIVVKLISAILNCFQCEFGKFILVHYAVAMLVESVLYDLTAPSSVCGSVIVS